MNEDRAINGLEVALFKLREQKMFDPGDEDVNEARGNVLLWMARLTSAIAAEHTA